MWRKHGPSGKITNMLISLLALHPNTLVYQVTKQCLFILRCVDKLLVVRTWLLVQRIHAVLNPGTFAEAQRLRNHSQDTEGDGVTSAAKYSGFNRKPEEDAFLQFPTAANANICRRRIFQEEERSDLSVIKTWTSFFQLRQTEQWWRRYMNDTNLISTPSIQKDWNNRKTLRNHFPSQWFHKQSIPESSVTRW